MNTNADAADQVVRIALESTTFLVKLTGTGAKHTALLLLSILKQNKKTRGAQRLSNMLRSGKPIKVYTFKTEDMAKFKEVAKEYGVLYTILKEKDNTGGVFDVFVRAEDESKMSRIIERFELTKVDSATLKAEILKEQEQQRTDNENVSEPDRDVQSKERDDMVADELLGKPVKKEGKRALNPTEARTEKELTQEVPPTSAPLFEPFSERTSDAQNAEGRMVSSKCKPSVKKHIEEIRHEIEKKENTKPITERKHTKKKSKNKNKER